MTHNIHTDAKPQWRVPRIALVVASTALISGGAILPASAATPTLSPPTAAKIVGTDDVGTDEDCDCGGLTGEAITENGYGNGSLYGPDGGLIHPKRDVTSPAISDDEGASLLDPDEVYVDEEEF